MLNNGKYEEAIIAFDTAIEIENKKDKAYIGLANTYVTKCDENAVNDAHEALSRGYELSTSKDIINEYLVLADELIEDKKENLAIDLLSNGYELTMEESIRDKINEVILNMNGELFDKIYSLLKNNGLDQVKEIMRSDEFTNLKQFINKGIPVIYSPEGENENNKSMGIYKIGSKLTQLFIYYGEYSDLSRNGNGIWIGFNFDGYSYTFKGSWNNDLPNGYGEINNDGITTSEYGDKESKFEWKGNLVDGLWNGDVEEIWISDEANSYNINFVNGIATVIGENNLVGRGSNGGGVYYSNLEHKHGVIGFED